MLLIALDAEKKSESLYLCFRRCCSLTMDLGMVRKTGVLFSLALARKTQGRLRRDNKVAHRGSFF